MSVDVAGEDDVVPCMTGGAAKGGALYGGRPCRWTRCGEQLCAVRGATAPFYKALKRGQSSWWRPGDCAVKFRSWRALE